MQVSNFIDQKIKPKEAEYTKAMNSFRESGNPWQVPEVLYDLKTEAKAEGLWNFFLPDDETGQGLSNLDYAYIAAELGRNPLASEFNSKFTSRPTKESFYKKMDKDHGFNNEILSDAFNSQSGTLLSFI